MVKKEPGESYSCIYVRDITVDARIGIYDFEEKPQRLLVSAALYVEPSYLKNASEQSLIDYKIIYDAVMAWSGRPHVKLIETYVQELLALAFSIKGVNAARVSIAKADIFPQATGAGVEAFMTREEFYKL